MKRLMTIVYILSALCVTAIITSCDKDTPEDWSEVVKLYVDAELGEYRLSFPDLSRRFFVSLAGTIDRFLQPY